MKKLINFYQKNPSYLSVGIERTAEKTNIAVSTITKFRSSQDFKTMKSQYLNTLKERKLAKMTSYKNTSK